MLLLFVQVSLLSQLLLAMLLLAACASVASATGGAGRELLGALFAIPFAAKPAKRR